MRFTILLVHEDLQGDEVQQVEAWLQRWGEQVRVAHSDYGEVYQWDVEAPAEAIAELPGEFLASSAWTDPLPIRRIQ